ncbi:MAG TPA: hypothetical protein ENG63_02000 [Candidatus Desulfofervidus auxilii]|uniref:Uncharacterized protein n=1 Tax=Desulfofervidus auxilii TaxID=1621989 RepID=A0A7C0U1V2_DESA2|nr:hypothetical protein [Candidatus Desulfofervidus auxilii]HDD43623.1 hypothetical protein [Candidatus Desulfofervidus auxilii]
MKILIGGLAALVLGVAGIIVFWKQFLIFLAGGIPLLLLLFGALASYLGIEELKDSLASQKETSMEIEDYKQEIEKLKAEIEELKKSKASESE